MEPETPKWKGANEEIIRKFEADDRELVESLHRRLGAYFRRHWTLIAHEAQDLAQDTLLKACELLEEFPNDGPFDQWLFGIARYTALHAVRSYRRRKGEETEPLHEIEDWEDLESEEDFSDRLVSALYLESYLDRLEPDQRRIVQLHIYEDRQWAEIANALGISTTAAEKRFQRILNKLGRWIEMEEPGLKVRRRS